MHVTCRCPSGFYLQSVTRKSSRTTAPGEKSQDRDWDACYRAFFDCFNREEFFEAHDVLEPLWLAERRGPNGAFYKGLIQLAGAFVHLQKQRLRPAAALLDRACANLEHYSPLHERLDVGAVLTVIGAWRRRLEEGSFTANPFASGADPEWRLRPPADASDG
jgi:uncharacterized protein